MEGITNSADKRNAITITIPASAWNNKINSSRGIYIVVPIESKGVSVVYKHPPSMASSYEAGMWAEIHNGELRIYSIHPDPGPLTITYIPSDTNAPLISLSDLRIRPFNGPRVVSVKFETISGNADLSGITVSVTGGSTQVTQADGKVTLEFDCPHTLIEYSKSNLKFFPSRLDMWYEDGCDRNPREDVVIKCLEYSTVTISIIDEDTGVSAHKSREVTITHPKETEKATTDDSGQATATLHNYGTYTASIVPPEGCYCDPVSFTIKGGQTIPVVLYVKRPIRYYLNYVPNVTVPTQMFTYSGDCAGYTPITNTNTTLGTVSSVGSWDWNTDRLLKRMYYATFNTDGSISQILNPYNLKLDQYGNVSDNTTKNTMLVIPHMERYLRDGFAFWDTREEGELRENNYPFEPHKASNKTYNNLAIGVYGGTIVNNKLMSISGTVSTASTNVATFRTAAKANGPTWMVTNLPQWSLLKALCYMVIKSTNVQAVIGNGGLRYDTGVTGLCDAMGPFAGTTANSTSAVKCFIENPWGHKKEFLDDTLGMFKYDVSNAFIYYGHNLLPGDTVDGKSSYQLATDVLAPAVSGFPTYVGSTTASRSVLLDMSAAVGGSATSGLCDYTIPPLSSGGTAVKAICVGGGSAQASNGRAGIGYMETLESLTYTATNLGARLTYLFD